MNTDRVVELKALLRSEVKTRKIVLDLKDLTLVNRSVVTFLKMCETDSIELKNCPAYIRDVDHERTTRQLAFGERRKDLRGALLDDTSIFSQVLTRPRVEHT
jgi:hypothetical protein